MPEAVRSGSVSGLPMPAMPTTCHLLCRGLLVIGLLLGSTLLQAEPAKDTPPASANIPSENEPFVIVLTRQDSQMDWWYRIPERVAPAINAVQKVTVGERLMVLPLFGFYGQTEQHESILTYDLRVLLADGTVIADAKDLKGFAGVTKTQILLAPSQRVAIVPEAKDGYGPRTVEVTVHDAVLDHHITRRATFEVVPFSSEVAKPDINKWLLNYVVETRPSDAFYYLTHLEAPFIKDEQPNWSSLSFFRHIYADNAFLIEPTIAFFDTKATEAQRADIIALFYVLDRLDDLKLRPKERVRIGQLKELLALPDVTVAALETPDALDWCWGEYFATGRVEPFRRIITGFRHHGDAGTLDAIKAGKLADNAQNWRKASRDLTFRSALWSVSSNLQQSPLLMSYAVALFEDQTNDLTPEEREVLVSLIQKEARRQKEAQTSRAR